MPVVLSLQEAEFFLDTIARLGNGELEWLAGLVRALKHTTVHHASSYNLTCHEFPNSSYTTHKLPECNLCNQTVYEQTQLNL